MSSDNKNQDGAKTEEDNQNVQVSIRVRPLLPHEVKKGHEQNNLALDNSGKVVQLATGDKTERKFYFDTVLDENYSQEDVFSAVEAKGLVGKVVDGYNATIFAYGQTGSGKTYTMEGYSYNVKKTRTGMGNPIAEIKETEAKNLGLVPRCIKEIFVQSEKSERMCTISCSFVQIYNEKVYDLLNPTHLKNGSLKNKKTDFQGLRMRYGASQGFYLENLYVYKCGTSRELQEMFQNGVQNKIMGSHNLNASSSRSHCLFTIYVESVDPSSTTDETVISSRLALVDLAGSERVSLTGATGSTLKEARHINTSLFALRKVITALSEANAGDDCNKSKKHIPYRDSKITALLQQSLGGSAHTLMIACITPSDEHATENLSTLTYATKANSIENKPIRNEDAKTRLIRKLRAEIKLLKDQLKNTQNTFMLKMQDTGTNIKDSKKDSFTPSKAYNMLKEKFLESISMIKRMHDVEKTMRTRMEEAEEREQEYKRKCQVLMIENQEIREREQMLIRVLEKDTSTSKDIEKGNVNLSVNQKDHEGGNAQTMLSQIIDLKRRNQELQDHVLVLNETHVRKHISKKAVPEQSRNRRKPKRKTEPRLGHLSVGQLRELLSVKPGPKAKQAQSPKKSRIKRPDNIHNLSTFHNKLFENSKVQSKAPEISHTFADTSKRDQKPIMVNLNKQVAELEKLLDQQSKLRTGTTSLI